MVCIGIQKILSAKMKPDPETDYVGAHAKVWGAIGGAMQASQLYVGDRLKLYSVLREACSEPRSSVTAIELAELTGYKQRWLREWLAQQASAGILTLLPGTGSDDADLHYRLPRALAEVLANPDSKEYDINMIKIVPPLVQRAKTMLPGAFETGIGRPYDDPEVTEAVDGNHQVEIRDVVIPKVIPMADNGNAFRALTGGCKVADLGCGAGNLLFAMAEAFPNSTFHGYEVSQVALASAAAKLSKLRYKNVRFVDANDDPLGSHKAEYDVITTFDVLHDATHPAELIRQVRNALKPGGVWILCDIKGLDNLRANIEHNPAASTLFAFSTCLCMSSSMSTSDGAGLGTLGLTIPVAKKMLIDGGFSSVKVLLEHNRSRWFEVLVNDNYQNN